jgi:hypothetical protein
MTCDTQQRLHDAVGPAGDPTDDMPASIGQFRKGLARCLETDALVASAGLPRACASMRADGLGQADLITGRPSRLAEAVTRTARHLVRSRSRSVRDGSQFACVLGGPIPRIRDAVQTALHDRESIPDPKLTDRQDHQAQIVAPLLLIRPVPARVLADPGVTCVG